MQSHAFETLKQLDHLILTDINDILQREACNECNIHLYHVGNSWFAFEKSAYLLQLLSDQVDAPICIEISGRPYPIIFNSISVSHLQSIKSTAPPQGSSAKYLKLTTEPLSHPLFNTWYSLIINGEI